MALTILQEGGVLDKDFDCPVRLVAITEPLAEEAPFPDDPRRVQEWIDDMRMEFIIFADGSIGFQNEDILFFERSQVLDILGAYTKYMGDETWKK